MLPHTRWKQNILHQVNILDEHLLVDADQK